ncbi:MAG: polysaccharide deacetylase family protein [Oscillospiraceae bacterium]
MTFTTIASASGEMEEAGTRLPIVMYHHLSEKPRLLNQHVLGVWEFENDLKYLRDKGYESISLGELLAWYEGNFEMPERPVLITFDDGFESTGVYAVPLLEKYGFNAVVAIIGSVADTYTQNPDHMLDYSYLSWEAIRELAEGGTVEIQCHTDNLHKYDARHGAAMKKGESLEDYRALLTADLNLCMEKAAANGVPMLKTLAYPYGSFSGETMEIIRGLGFKAGFTCDEQVNVLSGNSAELFRLHRFNRPSGISSESFFERWN